MFPSKQTPETVCFLCTEEKSIFYNGFICGAVSMNFPSTKCNHNKTFRSSTASKMTHFIKQKAKSHPMQCNFLSQHPLPQHKHKSNNNNNSDSLPSDLLCFDLLKHEPIWFLTTKEISIRLLAPILPPASDLHQPKPFWILLPNEIRISMRR